MAVDQARRRLLRGVGGFLQEAELRLPLHLQSRPRRKTVAEDYSLSSASDRRQHTGVFEVQIYKNRFRGLHPFGFSSWTII